MKIRIRRILTFLVAIILISFSVWFFLYVALSGRKYEYKSTVSRRNYDGLLDKFAYLTFDNSIKGDKPGDFINPNGILSRLPHQAIRESHYGYSNACSVMKFRPENISFEKFPYFNKEFIIDREPMNTWIKQDAMIEFCDDKIKLLDARFGLLKDIIIDSSKRVGARERPRGGEPFKTALGQEVKLGNFKFQKGFWKINCKSKDTPRNISKSFKWLPFIEINTNETAFNKTSQTATDDVVDQFTVAITREDYWNLHNFIRQMYNVFLVMMYFHKKPSETHILFMDGYPSFSFDTTWEYIFGNVSRAGVFTRPVLYRSLVWGFRECDGGLTDFALKQQAYLEEFRSYFLSVHGLTDSYSLNCQKITITLLLRRDQIFYPMNTDGKAQRKIFNEAELVGNLMKSFPTAHVQTVLMDSLPMCRQLEIASVTDILIGMHGAGMTHSIFLPKHAAILEMFPKDWKRGRPWYLCFEKTASWRGLKYDSWENFDSSLEMPNDYTIVPSDVIVNKTKVLFNKMCG